MRTDRNHLQIEKNVQCYATATGMFEYNTILAWYHLAIKRQDAKKGLESATRKDQLTKTCV